MNHYQQTPIGKDEQLWKIAQARASFRSHLAIYAVMSVVFWLVWFLTPARAAANVLPWPIWPMFGWGIGVAFHYIGAFITPKSNAAEREYQKLLQQQNKP